MLRPSWLLATTASLIRIQGFPSCLNLIYASRLDASVLAKFVETEVAGIAGADVPGSVRVRFASGLPLDSCPVVSCRFAIFAEESP